MQYSLHPQWQGVWEIRGNSRWNGERMVIMCSNDKCTLTEASSLEEYTLTSEPQSNLKAHWDFRSSGKAKRYYIGTLSQNKNYSEIEWSEMRKNRKTDKWIRVDLDPTQYLKQCKSRKSKHPNNQSRKPMVMVKQQKKQYPQQQYAHPHPHPHPHQPAHQHHPSHTNYNHNNNNNRKYVKLIKKQANNSTINDPAILNMKPYKYQTEHKPRKKNQFYVDYYPKQQNGGNDRFSNLVNVTDSYNNKNDLYPVYVDHNHIQQCIESPPRPQHKQSAVPPMNWELVSQLHTQPRLPDQHKTSHKSRHQIHSFKLQRATKYSLPRRTVLRHDQVHQPRNKRDRPRYSNNKQNKAAVLDAYLEQNTHDTNQPKRRRRNRNKFCKHLTKKETDVILQDTKTFKNAVLYVGQISVSRFNPNVAYVNVDGLKRDIRISGFIDRNRAYHGDTVVLSLYPEIEWMSAIKPEVKEFEDRLDERDKLNTVNAISAGMAGITFDDDVVEDAQDADDAYNGSSSSASPDTNDDGDEAEMVFFDDTDSDIKKNPIKLKKNKTGRRRLEDLVDKKSITAYDEYLFLSDMVSDFARFSAKWTNLDLHDPNHPRRDYIDKVIAKCGGKLPREALSLFAWSSPLDEHNAHQIARGKIVGIYKPKKGVKDCVPGFILPIRYTAAGQIDGRWAQFTPSDKRYPKARLPMRELPASLEDLFYKYEKEEIEIVQEYENRKYDLRRQQKERTNAASIKKRTNMYMDELKLMFFTMSFEHKWAVHNMQPKCHLRQELGRRGAIDVETNVILANHNISWRSKFTPEIERYVVENCVIDEADYVDRRDCRHMRVFSIDPTSARDFDDALSIQALNEVDASGKKLYLIGIHIADVTHFLDKDANNIVDTEAAFRATSVYLVDRCLPMLPHHLCQNLCSLNPGVDRLAYSVFVVLNEEGHLVKRERGDSDNGYGESPWFGRTVIRSRARLNYETAHWMLTKESMSVSSLDECCVLSDDVALPELVDDVQLFWSIASQMRGRRFASGSVKFFRGKIRFRLSKDNSRALVFGPEILLLSNNLVEEMMLLANQLVANKLISCIKEHTLLRRHPSPLQEKGRKLKLICRSQGMELKYDTPQQLNESLSEMEKVLYGETSAAKLINAQLAMSMMRAQYIVVEDSPPSDWRHWALNFPFYTHFTSPIRRYADVMVHRLLTYTLTMDKAEEGHLPSIEEMKSQCKVCNERNAAAHFAEIESQMIHLCLLLIDKPVIVDAQLIDIVGRIKCSVFVLVIPGLGIDVRVNIKDTMIESKGKIKSIDKELELPDTRLVIKWQSGECEEYKLFDTIRIKLYSKLKIPIKLCTEIIDPYARKYAIPANLQQETEEKEEYNNDNNDNGNDEFKCGSPVRMTLDSQLKVGTADFYASHYD